MAQLQVFNFSCIRSAVLTLGSINVLIGPQASGKSVLAKLLYFCLSLSQEQYEYLEKGKNFDQFLDHMRSKFCEWFPVSAWGHQNFKIEFQMSTYRVTLMRERHDQAPEKCLDLQVSDLVKNTYNKATDMRSMLAVDLGFFGAIQLTHRIKAWGYEEYFKSMGEEFIAYQMYVPAGRAFFTNFAQTVVTFDQKIATDPLTIDFGRQYVQMQQLLNMVGSSDLLVHEQIGRLLGGRILWDGDQPTVIYPDGRQVPFSSLSSGQQELLPLVLTMAGLRSGLLLHSGQESHLLYIEEPEAHLFPVAQSDLVQQLVADAHEVPARRLLLTTHSPYVLAKLNNLIKAGRIDGVLKPEKRGDFDDLVPPSFRIATGKMRAYALVDGQLVDILDDESGLIAADYLDDISGMIADEFSSLLDLEFGV
jgi:predicted ATP-binding protein involved in virulence